MKVLWISPFAPYDTVGHGGGQNHNYYVKYIKKNTTHDLTLLTVCDKNEESNIDLKKYSIDYILKVYDSTRFMSKIHSAMGKFFVFRDGALLNNSKRHLLLDAIREYSKRGEMPDVIIFQWTEAVMLIDYVKKYFPNSKCIAIEEDVAYLGYKRKYESAKKILRIYKGLKYKCLKRKEIASLKKCDCVIPLNTKDKELLVNEGICEKKILQMCSYHGFFENAQYKPDKYKLLFYGAMSRTENYTSAIWFIENVMPKLDDRYELYVVGSNPVEKLQQYDGARVHITGYVENIQPYFECCLCLVACLLLGAGIKIKVLEALSAGLPVITNEIGAEGIGLSDGVNYIYGATPDDYVRAINKLAEDEEFQKNISSNGRKHVMRYFDASQSLNGLIERMETL